MTQEEYYFFPEDSNEDVKYFEHITKLVQQQRKGEKYFCDFPLWGDGGDRHCEVGDEGQGVGNRGLIWRKLTSCQEGERTGLEMSLVKENVLHSFTDYIAKTRQLLTNVQFVQLAVKRDRSQSLEDSTHILMYIIEANSLFTQQEINTFESYLTNHKKCQQLISHLIVNITQNYRDQLLFVLSKIIIRLNNNEKNQNPEQKQIIISTIVSNVLGCPKLYELTFREFGCESMKEWQEIFEEFVRKLVDGLIEVEMVSDGDERDKERETGIIGGDFGAQGRYDTEAEAETEQLFTKMDLNGRKMRPF